MSDCPECGYVDDAHTVACPIGRGLEVEMSETTTRFVVTIDVTDRTPPLAVNRLNGALADAQKTEGVVVHHLATQQDVDAALARAGDRARMFG